MISTNGNIDLDKLERQAKIDITNFFKIYQVVDKMTKATYIAQIYRCTVDELNREKLIDFSREVNILTKLNHPSILRFYGFSLTNFKNEQRPFILLEKYSYNLYKFISDDKENKLNDTKILIIIYGIASAMNYLHSNEIIHRNLIPTSIYLDEKYYPKISDFTISLDLNDPNTPPRKNNKCKNEVNEVFLAPETINNFEYTKATDVLTFSLIVFLVLTQNIPLILTESESIDKMKEILTKKNIPDCYCKLIEKCWSHDQNKRPTFDEIVTELKTNPEFITDTIDQQEYETYIKYIEDSPITFESSNRIQFLDDLILLKKFKFKDSFIPNSDFNIDNYEIIETKTKKTMHCLFN